MDSLPSPARSVMLRRSSGLSSPISPLPPLASSSLKKPLPLASSSKSWRRDLMGLAGGLCALCLVWMWARPPLPHVVLQSEVDWNQVKLVSVLQPSPHKLHVRFEHLPDHEFHDFHLDLDLDMFSPSHHRQSRTYMMAKSPKEWASAQYSELEGLRGHFSSPRLGAHFTVSPLLTGNHDHVVRRVTEEVHFEDATAPAMDRPLLETLKRNPSALLVSQTPNDSPMAFTPGCYPNDQFAHTVQVGFAMDQGFMDKVGVRSLVDAQTYIESFFGVVRVIYLAQLNVYVQVDKLLLPNNNSSLLSSTLENGKCALGGAMSTLDRLDDYLVANKLSGNTGLWHLLTNCHPSPGVVGAAFIGGLGLSRTNCGVSSWTTSLWLVVAHEMGHGFGAQHTFQSDGQGGIMDYGNGRYQNGPVEFNPLNRDEICPVLTYAQSHSVYMSLTQKASVCGNGLLDVDEECECVDQTQTSCGACKGCRLTTLVGRECSTAQFVMHTTPGKAEVVSEQLLANADCCKQGVLAKQAQVCEGDGVCTPTGQCGKACGVFLIAGCMVGSSAFDGECVQRCLFNKKCWGKDLTSMGPPEVPVGAVPNGLQCNQGQGTCQSGVCEATTATTTAVPTTTTSTPTSTSTPSAAPTLSSASPSAAPVMDYSSLKCPNLPRFNKCPGKSKDACSKVKTGCEWCNNACKVSAVSCENMHVPYSVLYAHCPPYSN
ncbi:hypothetical protein BASA81_010794 [Batrachochytrium salamandrivorans]|nr:hypothetical protein BASA81_010794 [Batrachochytrium salamandrivorans]